MRSGRQPHPSQARRSRHPAALQLDFFAALGDHHAGTRRRGLKAGEAVRSPSVQHPDSDAGAGGEAAAGGAADGVLQEEGVALGKVSYRRHSSKLRNKLTRCLFFVLFFSFPTVAMILQPLTSY